VHAQKYVQALDQDLSDLHKGILGLINRFFGRKTAQEAGYD
jgi:hypothetical protein